MWCLRTAVKPGAGLNSVDWRPRRFNGLVTLYRSRVLCVGVIRSHGSEMKELNSGVMLVEDKEGFIESLKGRWSRSP